MADNVGITPGSGATAAADDIGGVLFQRVKVVHGADGVNDGDVAAGNPLPVTPLGTPGVARQLSAGSASANTALTSTCRRISIYARGADIRFAIGSASQTATSSSHFIAAGERLDVSVPATPNIAVIRAALTDGTLEVTELT